MDYSIAICHLQQTDPKMAQVIDRVGACRLAPGSLQGTLLSSLAETIVYQQLSGKAASTIFGRFVSLYPGDRFPPAAAILSTPDETLRQVGLSRQKISYLKDLASKIDQLPSLEALAEMEDDAIIQTLTQVRGIGRWTVQMLLIFDLNRLDVWPIEDLGVRSALRMVYELEAVPTPKVTLTMGELWKPYRSIAAWYLWQSLDIKTARSNRSPE